jgi:hypothetical protein
MLARAERRGAGLGIVILAWLLALNRRARRLEQTAGQSDSTGFFPNRFSATSGQLARHPFGESRGGQGRAGLEPFRAVFVVGRHDGQPRIFHQPARQRLGHRHRPRPAQSDRRRGRVFSFSDALSRKLGHVQFFYADRLLHHHAWARMDEGCVTRAYAWTGETVWNQGARRCRKSNWA